MIDGSHYLWLHVLLGTLLQMNLQVVSWYLCSLWQYSKCYKCLLQLCTLALTLCDREMMLVFSCLSLHCRTGCDLVHAVFFPLD